MTSLPHDTAAVEKMLADYEANMTKWMREPEQYRQLIVRETNKVLKLARWSLKAKKALERLQDGSGCPLHQCGVIADKALSSFPPSNG